MTKIQVKSMGQTTHLSNLLCKCCNEGEVALGGWTKSQQGVSMEATAKV